MEKLTEKLAEFCENIKFDVPILNLYSSNKKTNMEPTTVNIIF